MNILVDARFDGRGGVSRVGFGLLPALTQAMPEHHFIFATTGTHRSVGAIHELPLRNVTHVHKNIPNKLWSTLCTLQAVSFDQLFQNEHPNLLFLSNIGFVGSPKIPYTLLVHDISFLIEPRWFSLKQRLWHKAVHAKKLITEATHLFAVSEYTKKDLMIVLGIPSERITVIPMGQDVITPDDSPLPEILVGKKFVLAFGATDPRKNISCAISAVQKLRANASYRDVELVIIGSALAYQPTSLPAHKPLYINRPTDRELSALLKHASALLYPSWYEGFGLPLHEAARLGTPCIASTASALPETAPQGTIFAPPSKPHLWAQALTSVLDTPENFRTKSTLTNWDPAANAIKNTLANIRFS